MKHLSIRHLTAALLTPVVVTGFTSCGMMKDDLSDCPYGLYLQFKYDYNLQHADMFNDHCGAVDVYVFDEQGKFVKTQSEENTALDAPLADPNYRMHMDLAPGKYQLLVLAGQDSYSDQLASQRAHFVREQLSAGDDMSSLAIKLDTQSGDILTVDPKGEPLDTLWHGMETTPIEVFDQKPTYHTVSLVRDTKQITVSLREIDDPTTMDIDRYSMLIYDHNSHILWDNSLDETNEVVYKPQATWNTEDSTPAYDAAGDPQGEVGKIGHAYFMTSRILTHDSAADDGRLVVTDNETGKEVINVNLPDMLSRLANYDDLHRYSTQEFLDRGYDYNLEFFLRGGKLQYVNISISVLSWSVRVQFTEL